MRGMGDSDMGGLGIVCETAATVASGRALLISAEHSWYCSASNYGTYKLRSV